MSAGAQITPEERKARNKARMAEYCRRPEVKARKRVLNAEYRARPENKARHCARMQEYRARPDVKARSKAYHANPEIKAIKAEYRARPENKARMKMYQAEYYARPENKGRQKAELYGLRLEDLQTLLAADCAAAILGDSNRCGGLLQIDHDHQCCKGKRSCGRCVRSALCRKHNLALAGYESSVSWAGKYLARHQANQEGGRS